MPYIAIETNKEVDALAGKVTLQEMSRLVSGLLGKPEKYIMVSLRNLPMVMEGNDEPAAYVVLKSIGLPMQQCRDFSKEICTFLDAQLGIPQDRVYIDFQNIEGALFGYNSTTF